MNKRLLVTTDPLENESLRGYVQRVAERNAYESPRWIYDLCKLRIGNATNNLLSVKSSIPTLELLSLAVDQPKEALLKMTLYQEFGKYLESYPVEINTLFQFGISVQTTKICPLCVKETHYIQKIWDVNVFTCCPKHLCLLIQKCPSCNRAITHLSPFIHKCRCGFLYKDSEIVDVDKEETTLVQLLSLKLNSQGLSNIDKQNPLSSLSFRQICYVIMFFLFQVSKYNERQRLAFRNTKEATNHRMTHSVMNIFLDWPQSFYSFLEQFRHSSKDDRLTGVKKEFGNLHRQLLILLADEDYQFIHQQYDYYLSTQWDGGYRSRLLTVGKPNLKKINYISADEARIRAKTDYMKIAQLIETKKIDGIIRNRNQKNQILVNVDSLEEYMNHMKEQINLTEASVQLGLSAETTKRFICEGLLIGEEINTKHWSVSAQSINELLKEVERFSEQKGIKDFSDKDLVSFEKAVRIYIPKECDPVKFMKLILDGIIQPIAFGSGKGLKSYRFLNRTNTDTSEITKKIKAHQKNNDYMDMNTVAKLLKVGKNSIIQWVKKGFLPCEKTKRRVWFHLNDVSHFKMTYVSLTNLSKMTGRVGNKLLLSLNLLGIQSVQINDDDNGKPYLFEKKKLLSFFPDILQEKSKGSLIQLNAERLEGHTVLRELPNKIGVSIVSVYKWHKKGWLTCDEINGRKIVTQESIDAFLGRYTWLSKLSKEFGWKEPYMKKMLDNKGIFPLVTDSNDNGIPYIYLKSSISESLFQFDRF